MSSVLGVVKITSVHGELVEPFVSQVTCHVDEVEKGNGGRRLRRN